ncbi:PID domain-containing protein [Caenorhabditis elegans]|uniref:PID domain-containing protein n=1 Tax=Caenorhabditis elegans TaxID=6239 RepID=D0G910_CAEEL|nr:PID domain-containing protein [Caenorhabditis elegans]CCD68719.1 PID domain-containing protein [Caenorhabditis elegans]|eukprot:NP_001255265.1 Uncharacterized protein CELE_Y17G9B.11 [Caenorhabditis elegans]
MQMVLTRNMDIVVLHQSLKYDLNDVLNSDKCFRIRRLSKNQRCQYIFETLDSRSRQETGICEFRFYCIQIAISSALSMLRRLWIENFLFFCRWD